jgi:serine/threonine protein kinase
MDDVTRLPDEASRKTGLGTIGARDPSPTPSTWGRFEPGTIFAGRFRIVAPLGKGGMGEVYRADDLKLGQTVALKLLPEDLAANPARLAQFHNEVRVARTISHRNVCRVYDIGDAEDTPFLSMEYVDGEDLASLLRRIGRLPQDKAIDVARQICAGLAAAHERGVLHRDLKPANVMLDGEGHVRLTDFGLAALAGTVEDIRTGTPAYMAPEQLAGREVTERSDVYSLGLVLFELFTGKRAFEATSLQELLRLHESDSVATPSSLIRDLDPAIERVILRCLEREPARRPASALAVAAALPGGDQLAAALAAGETPSPEMVAAAGEKSAVQPAVGLALVGVTLAMLVGLAIVSQRLSIIQRIPFPRSTDALRDRAQETIERLGYPESPYDSTYAWALSREYINYASSRNSAADPWTALPSGRTGTATFWYRTGPVPLVSSTNNFLPSPSDPPLTVSGMRFIRVDPFGRLREFFGVPPQLEEPHAPERSPDWTPLFAAAGIDPAQFHPVEPRWLPRNHADARAAWEGPFPDVPGVTARIEAAAYRGRPIFFSLIGPWTTATREVVAPAASLDSVISTTATVIGNLVIVASALLARRHLRSGRGDRRGALRMAAIVFVCQSAGMLFHARHYDSFNTESYRFLEIAADALLSSAILWLLYLAFEPYVRRFWPQLLIGWSRFLGGDVRDPRVGRDILVGAAAGIAIALLYALRLIVPHLAGTQPVPQLPPPTILLGTRYAIATALLGVLRAVRIALEVFAIVIFLKIVLRRTSLVVAASMLVLLPLSLAGTFTNEHLAIELTISIASIVLGLALLLRFGLLSLLVTFYTFLTLESFPATTDFSRPYSGAAVVLMLSIAAVSMYGYYASRGDEPLFGRVFLD